MPNKSFQKLISLLSAFAIAAGTTAPAAIANPQAVFEDSAGSVFLEAPLCGFTSNELAQRYTSSAPYEKGGFKAPVAKSLEARVCKDDAVGDYIRVEYSSDESGNPYGGVQLTDENLNVSANGSNSFITFETTLRRNSNQRIYFYLIKEDGTRETTSVMTWWNSDSQNRLWWLYNKQNTSLVLNDNTWYHIELSLDLKNQAYKITVDGGAHESVSHTYSGSTHLPADVTYDGVGFGYLVPASKGETST
ncbi:MAG: hypothetical protein IKV73_02220 [Clostridia bacterium]|nr:hypothetical protein [Clostridia bacterium]